MIWNKPSNVVTSPVVTKPTIDANTPLVTKTATFALG